MGFNLSYRPLCDVQLWHGYFLVDDKQPKQYFFELSDTKKDKALRKYDLRNILNIVPTEATSEAMRKAKMLFRTTSTGFRIYISVKEDEITPTIEPKTYANFVFAIYPKDALLFNYTNLPLVPLTPKQSIYLTNAHQNQTTDHLFLSKTVGTFDPSINYVTGDYVLADIGGVQRMQEALQNNPGVPGVAGSHWQDIPTFQYVQRADQISILGRAFRLDFRNTGINQAQLELYRPGDGLQVLDMELKYDDSRLLNDYLVEIPDVAEGKYDMKVLVGGVEMPEWSGEILLSEEVGIDAFGIVELVQEDSMGDFSLFSSGKRKPNLEFVAFLPNRRTFWRYVFQPFDPEVPNPPVNPASNFSSENDTTVISDELKPLTRVYQPTIPLQGGDQVPNPSINLIKPDSTSGKIISETFIFKNLTP